MIIEIEGWVIRSEKIFGLSPIQLKGRYYVFKVITKHPEILHEIVVSNSSKRYIKKIIR